jgi:hypothetical protein
MRVNSINMKLEGVHFSIVSTIDIFIIFMLMLQPKFSLDFVCYRDFIDFLDKRSASRRE